MIEFDNRERRKPRSEPKGMHLTFTVNGKRLVYCYIRKNACSSFKNMIISSSPHAGERSKFPSTMGFLRQYHARSEQGLESFDHSVFVVRDTVERIVSVYKNKFVQRSGNKDIFANYAMRTGTDPELASFEDLVRDYLRHPFRKLDPHVWSQISHLDPAVYSDAILMDDLHASMTTIVGTELADRYFLGKVNSTSCRSVAVEDAWSIPSRDLHAFYLDRKVMPATASFITPALRERVREVYAEDFELYDAVRSAARRTARPCSGLPVAS